MVATTLLRLVRIYKQKVCWGKKVIFVVSFRLCFFVTIKCSLHVADDKGDQRFLTLTEHLSFTRLTYSFHFQ